MTKEQEKKILKVIQPLVEQIVKKQKLNENSKEDKFAEEVWDACNSASGHGMPQKQIIKCLLEIVAELKTETML